MSTIAVGGGAGGARSFSGVIAGAVVDGVRLLDLAAAGDPAVSVRGDARRAHTPLDRDINRMQQVSCSFRVVYECLLEMRKVKVRVALIEQLPVDYRGSKAVRRPSGLISNLFHFH